VDASYNDGLMHALQNHSEKEETCNFDVARQVHENLTKRGDPWFGVFGGKRWRDGQGPCSLQVFDGIVDVSELWRLDSFSKYLLWLIATSCVTPELDLEDQFFKRTPLHLWLWIFWDSLLKELLRAHSEHKSI
jgi:hypothetical protein